MTWLISPEQLEKFRRSQKNLVILDASFHGAERNGRQEFLEKHIIGATFFDIESLTDPTSDLPHTLLLDEKTIGEKLSALGLRNDCKIICYDNSAAHTACRALWMLKCAGHNPNLLYLLNGGLTAWEQYGGKVESGSPHVTPKAYNARFQPSYIRTLAQMKANVINPIEQVIDLRHPIRFAGGTEPRPHLRPGHIPGSYCLPYFTLFDKAGNLHPLEKISRQLSNIGIDFNMPIVTTCGSGITAAILNIVLDLLGHTRHALYDGSWTEWGAEALYPGEINLSERPVKTSINAT